MFSKPILLQLRQCLYPSDWYRARQRRYAAEIVREGYFSDTRYTIRYFQPDGEGTLRMDDGMVLLPNDRYPLDRDVFRLYYTSECEDQQTIDVYFEDNHDQLHQLTFTFNNEVKEEEDTTEGNTITPIGTIVSPININP